MGGSFVVDACVIAKALFSETGSDAARDLLDDADYIIAPDFALLEIASVALKKVRRREISQDVARCALDEAISFYGHLVPTRQIYEEGMMMAMRTMASGYDAVYAALAWREGLVLVTADKRFAASLVGHKDVPEILMLDGA